DVREEEGDCLSDLARRHGPRGEGLSAVPAELSALGVLLATGAASDHCSLVCLELAPCVRTVVAPNDEEAAAGGPAATRSRIRAAMTTLPFCSCSDRARSRAERHASGRPARASTWASASNACPRYSLKSVGSTMATASPMRRSASSSLPSSAAAIAATHRHWAWV